MRPANQFTLERVGSMLVVEPDKYFGTLAGCNHTESRQRLIDEIRNSRPEAVIVDFRHVECPGSYLLDTLCVAWKCLPAPSRRLVLCNLSETASEVVNVSHLNRLWPVYKSRREALDAQRRLDKMNVLDGDTRYLPVPGADASNRLHVMETGYRTVVGFEGGDIPPEHAVGRYLDELSELIADHGCRDFRFDLTGISSVPSGLLGIVTTLSKRGVHVSVSHPSPAVREVFELANLEHCLRSRAAGLTSSPEKSTSASTPKGSNATSKPEWMGTLFAIDRAPNTLIVSLGVNGTFRSAQLVAEAEALRRKLDDPSVKHLVLDLNGVNFVGSEVIGVLVGLANKVKAAGGKAAVCRVSMHVRDMLLNVGLLRTWPQCPSREAAVISVNKP